MNEKRLLIWLIGALFCLTACGESNIELAHVKRIVAHDTNHYTLWYSDSTDSKELKTSRLICNSDIRIILDAPAGADMVANISRFGSDKFTLCEATLHIHSVEEICGGGGSGL